MKAKLLVIDNDSTFCNLLQLMQIKRGFKVEVAHDGLSGLQKASTFDPDLILLDIMLTDIDGWEMCRRLRGMCDVPIMICTARDSTEDVIQGLDLGADAYVVKPVTIEELEARIRAMLRRLTRTKLNRSLRTPKFSYNDLVIDYAKCEVTVDGKRVGLTPTEFRLLSVLAQNKGHFLSHEYLLREVWGPESRNETTLLHQYICYLRRKIDRKPSKPNVIRNKWNFGYRFG